MHPDIELVIADCPHCGGEIVLFDGVSCGPCPHCHALYGLAQNQRPAGVLRRAWIPKMLTIADMMAVKQ